MAATATNPRAPREVIDFPANVLDLIGRVLNGKGQGTGIHIRFRKGHVAPLRFMRTHLDLARVLADQGKLT